MKIKLFLWKLGFCTAKCPYCGKKLIRHGFELDERFTCPDDNCEFNKPAKGVD